MLWKRRFRVLPLGRASERLRLAQSLLEKHPTLSAYNALLQIRLKGNPDDPHDKARGGIDGKEWPQVEPLPVPQVRVLSVELLVALLRVRCMGKLLTQARC